MLSSGTAIALHGVHGDRKTIAITSKQFQQDFQFSHVVVDDEDSFTRRACR
ncbi:hypothetical protein P606_27340 [Comamonas thiooxydans]|nr:hypothetical protein P606_27340 [Comamonas thiooxydans]